MSHRSEQLFNAVDQLTKAHAAWVAGPHNNPTPEYWDAVEDLLTVYEDGEIPADCRELAAAIDKLSIEHSRFEGRIDQNGGYPHDGFFVARQALEQARQATAVVEKPRLESIDELIRQGVPDKQIAKMHGHQVHEIEGYRNKTWKPAEGHLPPAERERMVKVSQASQQIEARLAGKRETVVAPESVQELLQQNVSFKQVAKMKGISEDEVLKVASELGMKVPPVAKPVAPAPVVETSVADEPEADEAADSPLSDEEMARKLHDEGHDQKDIAEHLGIKEHLVKRYLAKAKA